MQILTVNQFDNYLNDIAFQVSLATGVRDSKMLEEFRLYLKDYLIGEILSKKKHIDFEGYGDVPLGVKIALTASGISYGSLGGRELLVEGFDNSSFLYEHALDEAYNMDEELGNNYFDKKIYDFIVNSKRMTYPMLVCPLITYETCLNDRKIGYIHTSEEELKKANTLSNALYSLCDVVKKQMESDGLNSTNSLTYSIIDDLFGKDRHYSLPEKRALIGMAYVDTMISIGEAPDEETVSRTILNLEAASYLGDETIRKYKKIFDKEIKEYYGIGKIIEFPRR